MVEMLAFALAVCLEEVVTVLATLLLDAWV